MLQPPITHLFLCPLLHSPLLPPYLVQSLPHFLLHLLAGVGGESGTAPERKGKGEGAALIAKAAREKGEWGGTRELLSCYNEPRGELTARR